MGWEWCGPKRAFGRVRDKRESYIEGRVIWNHGCRGKTEGLWMSRQIYSTGLSSPIDRWSLQPPVTGCWGKLALRMGGRVRLGGWLHPTKTRLSRGARQAVYWGSEATHGVGLSQGKRLPCWLTPGLRAGLAVLPKATPCVGSTAGLPRRVQHSLNSSHFIPVAPGDRQGQPRSFQLTALREGCPHLTPTQPYLVYTTVPDLNMAGCRRRI